MANTKITGDLIAQGTIHSINLADGSVNADKLHNISTDHISEGTNLFYSDARVSTYLTTNNYVTTTEIANTANWDAAYTYSQVGHLPLTGGTISGDLTSSGTSFLFGGYNESSGVNFEIASDNYINMYMYAYDNAYTYMSTTYNSFDLQFRPANLIPNQNSNFILSYYVPSSNGDLAETNFNVDGIGVLTLKKTLSTFSNDLHAPIFYDSDNTSFYVDSTKISNWDTAYGWGNHASAGYLTSLPSHTHDDRYYTETEVNSLLSGKLGTSAKAADSELLDGSNSTYFDHRRYTDSSNYLGGYYVSGGTEKPNSSVFGAGKFKVAMLSGSNLGFGGSWNDVLWMSTYSGSDVKRSTALISSKYDNTSLWVAKQNFDSSSWGTGYLIWNSGNDGSGSGLDADLLDGQHASAFQPAGSYAPAGGSAATDWYCDDLYYDQWIRNNNTAASGLYWHNSSNPGYAWHIYPESRSDMTFRTGSSNGGIKGTVVDTTARGYIHWTTSNEIGFLNSSRSWSLRVDNSGNTFATASHRAPIFYDSNNTGYYADPASTSNFNQLNAATVYIGGGVYLQESSDRADLLQISSNTSGWGGLQIRNTSNEGRWSFMTDGEAAGIYNDEDNQWHIYMVEGQGVSLRYASNEKFTTTSGGISVTGTITASGDITAFSDERTKENIKTIDNPLDKIKSIRGVIFNKIGEKEESIGVIAQEIEKSIPQVVRSNDEGMKSVAYGNITAVLIEAIKELSNKVEELENKLNGTN